MLKRIRTSNKIKIFNDIKLIPSKCDSECIKCDNNRCSKCKKGYFLFESSCYQSCPNDKYADNYSFTCKNKISSPNYLKAYTTSRCFNSCGREFTECRFNGNCCSDYNICEIIQSDLKNNENCLIDNCKYCSEKTCMQCNENYYFYNNKCYLNCSSLQLKIEESKICLKKCSVYNCEKCENDICKKCINGHFLHENKCLEICPYNTRANKVDFSCHNLQEFSFYWIFPSKSSCNGKCGLENLDCSCVSNCVRKGNCCDDFEKECPNEFHLNECKLCDVCQNGNCQKCRDNSFGINHNLCECKQGFIFNEISNICVQNEIEHHTEEIEIHDPFEIEKSHELEISKHFIIEIPKHIEIQMPIEIQIHNDTVKQINTTKLIDSSNHYDTPKPIEAQTSNQTQRPIGIQNNDFSKVVEEVKKEKNELIEHVENDENDESEENDEHEENHIHNEHVLLDTIISFNPTNTTLANITTNRSSFDNSTKTPIKNFNSSLHKPLVNHSISRNKSNSLSLAEELKRNYYEMLDQVNSQNALKYITNQGLTNHYINGNMTLNLLNSNTNTTINSSENIILNSNNVDTSKHTNKNSFNNLSKIKKSGNVDKKINSGLINTDEKNIQKYLKYKRKSSSNSNSLYDNILKLGKTTNDPNYYFANDAFRGIISNIKNKNKPNTRNVSSRIKQESIRK